MALTPQQKKLITWGSHEKCMTPDCDEITQHKTGTCNKCRTHRCTDCGKGFISSVAGIPAKPRCAQCVRIKAKPDRWEADAMEYFTVKELEMGK